MCSFFAIQAQLSEIQNQFNFIYKTFGEILQSNKETDEKVGLLEQGLIKLAEFIDGSQLNFIEKGESIK
jgi:hypothetical protein